jgi:hypothetical protein
MTFPEIQLVDAPSASATVLFDFNNIDATPYRQVNGDEFTIGFPSLEGDVDAIDPLYSERVVSFTCNLRGTKPQVAATLSEMSRRLGAPGRGWLRVRLTSTSDLLFFRTYRAQPGDLSFDLVQSASDTKRESWDVDVTIPCEPGVLGELVSQQFKVVSQDPTSGTNSPTFLAIDPIAGDMPTPLRFRITNSTPLAGRSRLMIATHAGTLPGVYSVRQGLGSGDGANGSSDVTVVTGDSLYTNGSYRQVALTSSPSSNLTVPVDVRPGRYKVLLRTSVSNTTTTVAVRAGQQLGSGDIIYQSAVRTSAAGSGATWLDLGSLQLPFRRPQSPADLPVTTSQTLILDFSRTTGTGTLAADHLILMPVDRADTQAATTLTVEDVNWWQSTTNRALVVDGTSTDVWCMTPTTGALLDNAPTVQGVFPTGIPGAENFATVLFSTHPTASADTLGRNLTVTVSYYPRFLYIGDA